MPVLEKPTLKEIAVDIAEVVQIKGEAYGDALSSTTLCLDALYPEGMNGDDYANAALIIRILDKLKRIATNNENAGENPWLDVAGYALRAVYNARLKEFEEEPGAEVSDEVVREMLKQSLKDALEGKTKPLGSFAKYADLEDLVEPSTPAEVKETNDWVREFFAKADLSGFTTEPGETLYWECMCGYEASITPRNDRICERCGSSINHSVKNGE
jgi:hypothetical protein